MFTMSGNHHLLLAPDRVPHSKVKTLYLSFQLQIIFIIPKSKPLTHQAVCPHSILRSPRQLICLLSLWIYLFQTFRVSGIAQYVGFCV